MAEKINSRYSKIGEMSTALEKIQNLNAKKAFDNWKKLGSTQQ